MDERSIATPPAEMPIARHHRAEASGKPAPLDDPRALAILTTEHWNLLSARSLVYNEAFARAGMFLTFLGTTLFALGLVSTATGFSDAFLVVAAAILALDLFVGVATLGRLTATSAEDIRYLQGMSRLRHSYLEMVPGLEPYFISSHHDDAESVLAIYGPPAASPLAGILHGFTTMPGMIGTVCAVVSGTLIAIVLMLATHEPVAAGLGGLCGLALSFLLLTVIGVRSVSRVIASLSPIFPRPGPGS